MAEADQFLNSVIGYHDVTDTGGSKLPRRRLLDFPDGRVEDIDAVTQARLTLVPKWSDPSESVTGSKNDFAPVDFPTLTDVALNPTGGTRKITGFDATNLKVFVKRLWNLTTDASSLNLQHQNTLSALTNRIALPDETNLLMTVGQCVLLVRNPNGIGWRLLQCVS